MGSNVSDQSQREWVLGRKLIVDETLLGVQSESFRVGWINCGEGTFRF